jgi:hypothetical protein
LLLPSGRGGRSSRRNRQGRRPRGAPSSGSRARRPRSQELVKADPCGWQLAVPCGGEPRPWAPRRDEDRLPHETRPSGARPPEGRGVSSGGVRQTPRRTSLGHWWCKAPASGRRSRRGTRTASTPTGVGGSLWWRHSSRRRHGKQAISALLKDRGSRTPSCRRREIGKRLSSCDPGQCAVW